MQVVRRKCKRLDANGVSRCRVDERDCAGIDAIDAICYVLRVVKTAQGAPGPYSRALARAIRGLLGEEKISVRSLARQAGKSEPYYRDRLNGDVVLTVDDVIVIARVVGFDAAALMSRIAREVEASNVTPLRRNVGGEPDSLPQDEAYAASTDDSLPDPENHTP